MYRTIDTQQGIQFYNQLNSFFANICRTIQKQYFKPFRKKKSHCLAQIASSRHVSIFCKRSTLPASAFNILNYQINHQPFCRTNTWQILRPRKAAPRSLSHNASRKPRFASQLNSPTRVFQSFRQRRTSVVSKIFGETTARHTPSY